MFVLKFKTIYALFCCVHENEDSNYYSLVTLLFMDMGYLSTDIVIWGGRDKQILVDSPFIKA
jgi:hypothetical protein